MSNKTPKQDYKIYAVKPDEDVNVVKRELNPPLDKPPFIHLYVGTRGSGKTNALVNLHMRHCFYGMNPDDDEDYVFDETIVISSTLGSDQTSRHLVEHATKTYDFYDDGIIANIINHQKLLPKKERRHIHIVCDDIITLVKQNSLIFKLCSNHRHYLCSISFLVQAPKAVSPLVWNCATRIFIFRNPSFAEQEKIFERISFMGGKKSIEAMYEYATKEPYCFLVINASDFSAWQMGPVPPSMIWSRYDENGNYSNPFEPTSQEIKDEKVE